MNILIIISVQTVETNSQLIASQKMHIEKKIHKRIYTYVLNFKEKTQKDLRLSLVNIALRS